MPNTARRRHPIDTGGSWGTGLLCLGIAVLAQGFAFIQASPKDLNNTLQWINQIIPVAGWGLLWVVAGGSSIWRALRPPQRHSDLVPAVGVICLWFGFYFTHWLILGFSGHWTRDWTAALAWGSLAAVLIFFGRCINPPRRDSS